MSRLTQVQVAAIMGLTTRRIQQLAEKQEGPPKADDGDGYDPKTFGEWWRAQEAKVDRARLLKAQADVAEIEAEKARSEVVMVADAQAFWEQFAAALRARLLNLAPTTAPLMVGKPVAEALSILQAKVNEALAELSGDGRLRSH